jgi:hypothetical protein
MSGTGVVTLVKAPYTGLLAVGGTVLPNSNVIVDLSDCQYVRSQFNTATLLASASVQVNFSVDGGTTWLVLVSPDSSIGPNPFTSAWQQIPPGAIGVGDVLLNAQMIVTGLAVTATVNWVDLHFR